MAKITLANTALANTGVAKTVLITGASTGIGRAVAQRFDQAGWQVIATLRRPDQANYRLERGIFLPLDVTDPASIQAAIAQVQSRYGGLDVLINNAGYALYGPFESATSEQIQRQFATNVFGLMQMTQAVLPMMRDRRSGVIVNVASIGGRLAFPLYSLYHSSKWAVEGFSESLQYELAPFQIRVKLIEPGPIKTDFYQRSPEVTTGIAAYEPFATRVMAKLNQFGAQGSPPEVVAAVIYGAATDGSQRLRYPAGGNAAALLGLRKLLPDWLFRRFVRSQTIR